MKRKFKTLIATAMVATMMIGTNMTACAAPDASWGAPTQVTPNGVLVYGEYTTDLWGLNSMPYPAVYLNAIDAAGITNEMGDMEKCVRINNYICAVVTYEECEDFNTPEWAGRGLVNGEYALTTGHGICMDYADAFQTMCSMVGIDCTHINSAMMMHGWNEVVIDGVTYYNDVTWNDTTGNAYLMSPVLWADHAYADAKVLY